MKQTFFVELTQQDINKFVFTGRIVKENKDVRIIILRANTVNII